MCITVLNKDIFGNKTPMVVGKAMVKRNLKIDNYRKDKYKCYFEFKQAKYIS